MSDDKDCDLCDINEAVHRLPQDSREDLAICDDCAVGRRESVVEDAYAGETIDCPFAEASVELEAGGRRWEGSPEEFKALRDRLNEVEFRD